MKNPKLFLIIVFMFISYNIIGQSSIYDIILAKTNAIGRILMVTDSAKAGFNPIGTGFIGGSKKDVITCSHVVVADTLYFQPIGKETIYRIRTKFKINCLDVAYMERTSGENKVFLDFGNFDKVQPGDSIYYIGYDKRNNKYGIWSAIVESKGLTYVNENCSVDFIEYKGEAIPGYSGGPVFNEEGKIIAIVAEGWNTVGIRGDKKYINRAFSINILKLLDSEIDLKNSSDIDNNKLIDIINNIH